MTEMEKNLQELEQMFKKGMLDRESYLSMKEQIKENMKNITVEEITVKAPPPKKKSVPPPPSESESETEEEVKTIAPEFSPGFGRGKKVLVVDDSAFIGKQMSQILTYEGFDVIAMAADGEQGVQKYKELRSTIDLVTVDIIMPVMDGITALEEILKYDKNAKVVMVSSAGQEDKVKKCLLMGAKSYVKKPLDRNAVLNRIFSLFK